MSCISRGKGGTGKWDEKKRKARLGGTTCLAFKAKDGQEYPQVMRSLASIDLAA